MATVYLERHTVEFTPELWAFCKSEVEKNEPVQRHAVFDSGYDTIEFRTVPSEVVSKVVVTAKRVDADHVRLTADAYLTKRYRNGRTAGWRTWAVTDLREDPNKEAPAYGKFFDLKGNVMPKGHLNTEWDNLGNEVIDITEIVVYAFYFVQKVLHDKPDALEEVEEQLPVKEVHKRPKHSNRRNSTPTVATTRTYRVYRIKRDFDFTERNPIVRSCRLWSVRGHTRRLKSGKVIQVAPYYKGVDRALARPEDGDYGRLIKVRPST